MSEAIMGRVIRRWARRNECYGVSSEDMWQEARLAVLTTPTTHVSESTRVWNATRKACAKVVVQQRSSVSMPYQYLSGKPNKASEASEGALEKLSLDRRTNDESEDTFCDMVACEDPSPAQAAHAAHVIRELRALLTPAQAYALDGILEGQDLAEIGRARGVSRAKISLEFKAILRHVASIVGVS